MSLGRCRIWRCTLDMTPRGVCGIRDFLGERNQEVSIDRVRPDPGSRQYRSKAALALKTLAARKRRVESSRVRFKEGLGGKT